MAPSLTIIIPTHHRPAILKQTLEHLSKQTIAEQLEVIVVHDGEDDEETKKVFQEAGGWRLAASSYFAIAKSHQGTARNRGAEKASAPIILFIGDDAFLETDACERHLRGHSLTPNPSPSPRTLTGRGETFAVLGFTTWDPTLEINPTMRWLEKSGWQFGYPMIEKYAHGFIPKEIQERFTYTIHISVPTAVAKKFPFREDVSLYGWEDIVWGTELKNASIPLYYEPDAKAFHHHHITLEQSLKRMETLGKSLKHLEKIDSTFQKSPKGMKLLAYKIISMMPTMRGMHSKAFLRGLKRELIYSKPNL